MKKMVLVLLILAVMGGTAFAFDILSYPPPLEGGGDLLIDVGVGLQLFSWGTLTVPPLFLNVEYSLPVGVPISVGGFFAFSQYKSAWYSGADYGYRYSYFTFGARANWHWAFDVKWLDFYTGAWLGANIVAAEWYGDGHNSGWDATNYSGFGVGFQVGAHFYFTDFIGVVVESGYPYFLKAGLALKF